MSARVDAEAARAMYADAVTWIKAGVPIMTEPAVRAAFVRTHDALAQALADLVVSERASDEYARLWHRDAELLKASEQARQRAEDEVRKWESLYGTWPGGPALLAPDAPLEADSAGSPRQGLEGDCPAGDPEWHKFQESQG
jgi:hypothetical protein